MQNYGYTSKYFTKGKSINQGCCFSPSIYLLIAEIIANKLRNNNKIEGVALGNTKLLLSQFADDMDMYLPFQETVLNEVISVLSTMEANLGVQVSYDKTVLYRIGSIANTNAKFYTIKPIQWSNNFINTLGVDIHNKKSDLCANFDNVLNKMRAVSEVWYYRNMTIMGKILLVNTLLSSLFVYKLQVIPQISKQQMEEYDSIVQNFIWKGKSAKIPLSILQAPKKDGGMGLIDLKTKAKSLLINWIPRIYSSNILFDLARYHIGPAVEQHLVFKTNLHHTDVSSINNRLKGSFWQTLLQEWCKYNSHYPQNADSVLEEYLWYNSNIRINNKICYQADLIKAGIVQIKDIYDQNTHRFLTATQCSRKFDCNIQWLPFNAIIQAIPQHWKRILKTEDLIDSHQPKFDKLAIDKPGYSIARTIYYDMASTDQAFISSQQKWSKKMNIDIDVHRKALRNLYTVTNITKYRDFQLRLLHNKIFCNDVLYYWKIKDSQKCEFCNECDKQDIVHLMYQCKVIKRFWDNFHEFLESIMDASAIEWTTANVIYNTIHPRPGHVANFMLIVAKFHIFRSKCNNETPSITACKAEVYLMYRIEEYNAINSNRCSKHNKKWKIVNTSNFIS